MDQTLSRLLSTHPEDHSLDGLPISAILFVFAAIVLVSLALRITGRSWRAWHLPATIVFLVWFCGINLGHFGFESGAGKLGVIVGLAAVAQPAVRLFRAALRPNTVPRGENRLN
jgi:hypothetical protein